MARATPSKALPWNRLQNIGTFVEATNFQSFSAASTAMRRATSAIARSVRMLETALDAELIERSARGILLTHAGKLTRERGLHILNEINAMAEIYRHPAARDHTSLHSLTHLFTTGRKLETLIDLDATQSVGRTADNLHLSQSAVSMTLAKIEAVVGEALYLRTRRGLDPQPRTHLLVRHAKRVAAELRYVRDEIASLSGGVGGTVVVGLLSMARTELFPTAVARALATYPRIRVKALDWSFDQLVEGLRSGEVDFSIGVVRDGSEHNGLIAEPLMDDDLRLLVRSGNPLLHTGISLADLTQERWILPRPNSRGAQSIRAHFGRLGRAMPEPSVETADLQLIRQLLLSTDMIAVASPHQLSFELRSGLLRALPIELDGTRREIALLRRESAHLSPAALALMDMIRQAAASIVI